MPIKTGIYILGCIYMIVNFKWIVIAVAWSVLNIINFVWAIGDKQNRILFFVYIFPPWLFVGPYTFYFGRWWKRWFYKDSKQTRMGLTKYFKINCWINIVFTLLMWGVYYSLFLILVIRPGILKPLFIYPICNL